MSHLPFACNWQNKFLDSEPVVARFLNNTYGTLDIRISHNFIELHPALCVRVVCRVCGLGLSHTLKQNIVSYYFDYISRAQESKEEHL